jgi:hypothetical protein
MRSTLAKLRSRMTYANVMSTLAVFLALGTGTAFAVAAANSVVSSSIKDGEVKNPDVGADAVNGAKVSANSLTGTDINESSLGKVPLAAHLSGAVSRTSPVAAVPAGQGKIVNAQCPAGLIAAAGGYNLWTLGPNGARLVDRNFIVASTLSAGGRWQVQVANYSARAGRVQVQASCLPLTAPG